MGPFIIVFYFTTIMFVIAKSILKNVMFTWKCAVDEMYVTSLPVNYPLKNTSIAPTLYMFGKSASVMQFAYRVRFPASYIKHEKIPLASHTYHLFIYYKHLYFCSRGTYILDGLKNCCEKPKLLISNNILFKCLQCR